MTTESDIKSVIETNLSSSDITYNMELAQDYLESRLGSGLDTSQGTLSRVKALITAHFISTTKEPLLRTQSIGKLSETYNVIESTYLKRARELYPLLIKTQKVQIV